MSLVTNTTVKSSRWCNGEDESERSLGTTVKNGTYLNNCCCAQHHGGVGGRGMHAQEMEIKVEVCDGVNSTRVFSRMQGWLENQMRAWLWRKYGCKHGRYKFYTKERMRGQYKLWEMPMKAAWSR